MELKWKKWTSNDRKWTDVEMNSACFKHTAEARLSAVIVHAAGLAHITIDIVHFAGWGTVWAIWPDLLYLSCVEALEAQVCCGSVVWKKKKSSSLCPLNPKGEEQRSLSEPYGVRCRQQQTLPDCCFVLVCFVPPDIVTSTGTLTVERWTQQWIHVCELVNGMYSRFITPSTEPGPLI